MDRRTILALILTAIVIVATPILFPSRQPLPAARDTSHAAVVPVPHADSTRRIPPVAPVQVPRSAASRVLSDTTVVRTNRAEYRIVSPGGTPIGVELSDFRSLTPGVPRQDRVELVESGERMMSLHLVSGGDTVALDSVSFSKSGPRRDGAYVVVTLTSVSTRVPITLTYRFAMDSFAVSVRGTIGATGAATATAASSALLISLPSHLRSQEANALDDVRHLAFGYKRTGRDVQNVTFHDLDSTVTRVDTGGILWVAERNKYFVIAAVATAPDTVFRSVLLRGGHRNGRDATTASGAVVLPFTGNDFAFRMFAGPQSWEHLRATAADFENVNPVGGWTHTVVQPFTTIVLRLLLWMRRTFRVEYGWVLIILGVMIRMLLWPLQQRSMRASMQMQRLQPELAEIQKRYRNDPQRQQEAVMKVYKDHGMSPFSPLLGCLPMLLPMPILFALYFVFQNTIELRGVAFLWLPDLSLRDPYFITPLFMGASMFLMSWIGMRGMPPSPQGKMMSYAMPVMFTVLFWNFASGLNVYYAVQNIAAIPQQWLLARERAANPPPNPGRPKGA